MSSQDLLIVVGCEELPAGYVQYAATELQKNLLKLLKGIEHGTMQPPMRLQGTLLFPFQQWLHMPRLKPVRQSTLLTERL